MELVGYEDDEARSHEVFSFVAVHNSTKTIGHSIVKALRPKQYNYKGLFCSARDLDSIDSVVYLTHEECIVLANCKREKIEKLELQYELLDGDIGK